ERGLGTTCGRADGDRLGGPDGGRGRRRRGCPAARSLPAHTGRSHRRRGFACGRRHAQGRPCADQPRGAARRRRAGRRTEAGDRRTRGPGRRGICRRTGRRPRAPEHGDAGATRLAARNRPRDRAKDPRLPPAARRVHLGGRVGRRAGNRSGTARPAQGPGGAVIPTALRSPPHSLLASLCVGIALANLVRLPLLAALACLAALLAVAKSWRAVGTIACLLVVGGWCWGSARLDRLDHSVLRSQVGRAETALVVVTGPPRRGRFDLKMPARVRRFGLLTVDEPAQLELPLGRAPPQGGILEVRAEAKLPHGPRHGFDERTWLRRHGIHVVLAGDRWELVGRRHGLGGLGDRLRAWLAGSVAGGLRGERRGVLLGVVLGDEQGLDERLRTDFRASGLYHLLAVSGQNVALVAGGALMLAWLLGIPRWLGQVGALVSIGGYVLAVGAQPSVLRAGVAGALGSL